MMDHSNPYNIIIPEGQAERPYYAMSDEEQRLVGKQIFQRAIQAAEKVGAKPVIGNSKLTRKKSHALT